MGDTGAMLLGLLLAYGPISSTASLDQNVLVNYSHLHPVHGFPTILPLLLPVAILIIPYTDLLLAVIRRTRAGKSPLAADREDLHHRLLNMGHSHRQSVLIMYLWATMFSGMVVGLSLIRLPLIWLALATVGAMAVLLLATMPRLRPWRAEVNGKRERVGVSRVRSGGPGGAAVYGAMPPNAAVPAVPGAVPGGPPPNGAAPSGVPVLGGPLPSQSVPGRPLRPHAAPTAAPANGGVPANGVFPANGAMPPEGSPNRVLPPNGMIPPNPAGLPGGVAPEVPGVPGPPSRMDSALPGATDRPASRRRATPHWPSRS